MPRPFAPMVAIAINGVGVYHVVAKAEAGRTRSRATPQTADRKTASDEQQTLFASERIVGRLCLQTQVGQVPSD